MAAALPNLLADPVFGLYAVSSGWLVVQLVRGTHPLALIAAA
jgi:hypothetical protein